MKEDLKEGQTLIYFDHGVPRTRMIEKVVRYEKKYDEWHNGEWYKIMRKLKRSTYSSKPVVYFTWFCNSKNIEPRILIKTNIDGQYWDGAVYYWESLDKWKLHTEIREIKAHGKIENAIRSISHAQRILESISMMRNNLEKRIWLLKK